MARNFWAWMLALAILQLWTTGAAACGKLDKLVAEHRGISAPLKDELRRLIAESARLEDAAAALLANGAHGACRHSTVSIHKKVHGIMESWVVTHKRIHDIMESLVALHQIEERKMEDDLRNRYEICALLVAMLLLYLLLSIPFGMLDFEFF